MLLDALGTPDAGDRAARLWGQAGQAEHRSSRPRVAVGPEGVLFWPRAEARQDSDSRPLHPARDLERYAVDPACHLSDRDAADLAARAARTDATDLWRSRGLTSGEAAIRDAIPALARWAPDSLASLYRRAFASVVHRTQVALSRLANELPSHLLLLDADDCAAIANAPVSDDGESGFVRRLSLASLTGRTATEQITYFAGRREGPCFESEHAEILTTPLEADLELIAGELTTERPADHLCRWLQYLTRVGLGAMRSDFPLAPLLKHDDARVRRWALDVAHQAPRSAVARQVVESGWSASPQMDREEARHGSLALLHAAALLPPAELRSRIHPEGRMLLAGLPEATDLDLEAFAERLGEEIRSDLGGAGSTHSHDDRLFRLEAATERLVEQHAARVLGWLQPILTRTARPALGMLHDDFPYLDLCRALLKHRPEQGAYLWRVMHEDRGAVAFQRSTFDLLPFEAPDSPPIHQLRDLCCDSATTDQALGRIASACIFYDRQEWLLRRIHADLAGTSAGMIARGLWLAGLLHATPAADELWRGHLAEAPGRGWLTAVHWRARRNFDENRWAHHWHSRFLAESDRDRAFGYYQLFLRCADPRVHGWAFRQANTAWPDLPRAWQVHLELNREKLTKVIEGKERKWKDQLFGTRIPSRHQWPWTS